MKKTALIIGFYYQNSTYYESYRTLSGALIDVYQAYTHCKELGFEIQIIGDFLEEPTPKSMNKAILNGYVDVDILDFCRDCEAQITNISTKYGFKQTLKDHLQECGDVLFVYFSGHGSPCGKNLILPNNFTMKWESFYKRILSSTPPSTEVCCVVDCCYAPHFDLPYKLRKNRFRLRDPHASSHAQHIYLFCSSKNDETAASSDNGSLFTRFLFQHLTAILKDRNLGIGMASLKQHIDECVHETHKTKSTQHVCIYSSYPTLPFLKYWIWNTSLNSTSTKIVFGLRKQNNHGKTS